MLAFPIIRVDLCYSWFPLLHAVNGTGNRAARPLAGSAPVAYGSSCC